MELSIESLQSRGAFTGAPVEKTVTWEQGEEELKATVYVRPMSYHTARSDIVSVRSESDALAGRIAACICDSKGNPVFTPQDITGEADPERGPLNSALTMALLGVISEVSSLGKARKSSPKKTSSGTNS